MDVALLFLALRSPGLNVQWSYFTLTERVFSPDQSGLYVVRDVK